jgi:hypothetical protein
MYRIFRRKTKLKTFVAVYCHLQLLFKPFKVIKVPLQEHQRRKCYNGNIRDNHSNITSGNNISNLSRTGALVHLCNELTAATVAPQEEPY